MEEPHVTDVFKFVSLRAPALVTTEETANFIRDDRLADEGQRADLMSFAQRLSDRAQADSDWSNADLAPAIQGFQAWKKVKATYLDLRAQTVKGIVAGTLSGDEILTDAGASEFLADIDHARRESWKLLYVAYAVGSRGGDKLTYPHACLQLIKFAESLLVEPNPDPLVALKTLDSPVVISPLFVEKLANPLPRRGVGVRKARAADGGASAAGEVKHGEEIATLARNVVAVNQLIEAIDSKIAKADHVPQITEQKFETPGTSSWTTRVIRRVTSPTARTVLPMQLTEVQADVLDRLGITESTSMPEVRKLLIEQSRTMSPVATKVSMDPIFQKTLNEELNPAFTTLIPAGLLPTGTGTGGAQAPPTSSPLDVDMSDYIQPLGIGELKKVRQTLTAYVAGEVADVVNIMNGEEKGRTHRRLDRTEVTIFEASETDTSDERDNQTTDRYELKNEAEQTINTSQDLKLGVNVSGSYGPVKITANTEYATSTSKQLATKSSSDFAHEVVDKSIQSIQTKIRSERTTKTITEVEEINTHSMKGNAPGGEHTIGIYRWVDKKYHAEVWDYGVRLILEFVVAEPAAYYRAAKAQASTPSVSVAPPPDLLQYWNDQGGPIYPVPGVSDLESLQPFHLTESNYHLYAARFGATDVTPPPDTYTTAGATLASTGPTDRGKAVSLAGDGKFAVPKDYTLLWIDFGITAITYSDEFPDIAVQFLDKVFVLQETLFPNGKSNLVPSGEATLLSDPGAKSAVDPQIGIVTGPIPIAVSAYDTQTVAVTFEAYCKLSETARHTWQMTTYKQIFAAWENTKKIYDQAVADANPDSLDFTAIQGQNPATNKKLLEDELKKLSITMMTGEHFDRYGAMVDGAAPALAELQPIKSLRDGRIQQFFEQAFEWENMTYLFYSYFWGRKQKWTDYEFITDVDPLFQGFLNAGAARVQVPVPRAYEDDVIFLLQSHGQQKLDLSQKVWGGGPVVYLDDPRYVSIVDELRSQTDDSEGSIDPTIEPWDFKLPTTLVWLQPTGDLPTYPAEGE